MYGYSAAKLSRNPDGFSQPGDIPHRPALIGMHLDKKKVAVIHELYVVSPLRTKQNSILLSCLT
jgi:hypothetical protein